MRICAHLYPIHPTGATDPNYDIQFFDGMLEVRPAQRIPPRPGSLDPSFDPSVSGQLVGVGGQLRTVVGIAVQPDGKVLFGAQAYVDGYPAPHVGRLERDGSLDPTFRAYWDQFRDTARLDALGLLPDGKVLASGVSLPDAEDPDEETGCLVRFNTSGGLDALFNLWCDWIPESLCLAVQPDGKILLGGSLTSCGSSIDGLVRLHPAGGVDDQLAAAPSDLVGGIVKTIALQSDGKIVIGGEFTWRNGLSQPQLARLNPDGTLDASFNPGWIKSSVVNCVTVTPEGQILAGGLLNFGQLEASALVRLHPDGSRDTNFGNQLFGAEIETVAVQSDGRILVGGWFRNVFRLNPDGTTDPSFQTDFEYDDGPPRTRVITLDPDGAILVGGSFTGVNGYPIRGLARLHAQPPPFVRRHIAQPMVELAVTPPTNVSVYAVEDQVHPAAVIASISHDGVFDEATGKVKFGPFYDHEPRTLSYSVLIPPGCLYGLCGMFTFTGTASADGVNTPVTGDAIMLVAGLHPADFTPTDSHLTIAEVTAYGAAWRRGSDWTVPPNPIPIDYVTRAAFLWRGGECYEVDLAATNAPLCWVNCRPSGLAIPPEVQRASASYSGSARSLPSVYVPGEAVTVTITAAPGPTAQAYALEDQTPPGWTVSSISDGGEFDAVHGRVKWGPFLDRTSRTLNYQLLPPADAVGTVSFIGTASIDGVSAAIAGPRQLRAGSRLAIGHDPGNGRLVLRLSGERGRRYLIEASSDLVNWTPWATGTNVLGQVECADPAAANLRQRFYRARCEP